MKIHALFSFLLFFLTFIAQAQLQLVSGSRVTNLVDAGGGTYTEAITLTVNSEIRTKDNKEYTISGNISGAFNLTVTLFAGSKITLSGAVTAVSTAVSGSGGELILTNTAGFRSYNLDVATGNTLTFDASGDGSPNSDTPFPLFGDNFTSDFTVTGAGQVSFKGAANKFYKINSPTSSKSIIFNMASGGQLNIESGNWRMGASGMSMTGNNNSANLNVAANTIFTIEATTVQFNKLTGTGSIKSVASAAGETTIKIGVANGTSDWGGIFSETSSTASGVRKINIEKLGTGSIAFTADSRPTGTITITAGALSVSNGDYTGKIVNNATLILNQSGNYDFNYHISGNGNIVKKEAGEATLTGGTTGIVGHTGTTTVESGVLTLKCKEIKTSDLIVKGGATLTTPPGNTTNNGEVATGNLSLLANSTLHFKFTNGNIPLTKLAASAITAPTGFLIRFSGTASSLFRGDKITLIRCNGTLPTTLPKIVENSIDFGAGSKKCILLNWENGTGLVAVITYTGPSISPASAAICIGATQRLTVSDGGTPATPAWTSANSNIVSISADGLATGLRIGDGVVIYTNTNGCVVTSPIRVNGHTVRPEDPQAAFCPGDIVKLKAYDSPTGGTNSSFNPAWTSEHPLIATVAGDQAVPGKPEADVTLLTTGSAIIKFKDSNGCFNEYTVNVKSAPTLSSSKAAICPGSSILLKGSERGTWSSSNTQAVTVIANGWDKAWATGAAVGDATVTFAGSSGCNATALLSVRTSATIANAGEDKEICAGTGVTIGAPAQNGVTYSWSPSTGLSASDAANPVATPMETRTYTVTAGFSVTQCPSATDRVEVKVNPKPDVTSAQGLSSRIQPETAINLSASTAGTTRSWSSSDVTKVTVSPGTDMRSATATGVAVGDANITFTDAKGCVTIHPVTVFTKTRQDITFFPIPDKTVGDPDFTLSAISTSKLPITYTTASDKVIITGKSVKIVKAGKASIQANQPENDTYFPSTRMSNIFCINPAKPSISIDKRTLTSSADNGNQWYLDSNLIDGATGKTYTATANGSYTVKVTIEECTGVFSNPINPSKSAQTITFPVIPDKTVGDPDFTLSATATSELPITYTTASDKVTITGSSVKIVKAGKVSILATQPGNDAYNPATQTNSFCIKPQKPSITINNRTLTSLADIGNQWYFNGNPIEAATGKTYTAPLKADGNYSVKVTVDECVSDFSDPVSVSSPGKTTQTITFPAIPDKTVGDPDFTLSATATSELPITYTTASDKVTITGNSVKIVKAGKASIHANQAGNNTYDPAAQISNTFCINPAKPAFTLDNRTLTSSADAGNQWYADKKPIEGATEKTYTALVDGSYTVKVTIEECASVFSEPATVLVTGDISADELRVFPIPAHDQLAIELSSHENGLISLFSVAGQNLYSTSAVGKTIISMKDFPAGIYILKIQTAGKIRVRKVAKN